VTRAALAIAVMVAACHPPAKQRVAIENHSIDDVGNRSPQIDYPDGPITEESLAQFLSWRFTSELGDGTFEATYNDTQDDVIDELHAMGIRTIHDLAEIIPADFETLGAGEFIVDDPANIPGLVRDFMMISDADYYFQHAWKSRWQSILPANVSALKAYIGDFTPFYDAGVLTADEVKDAPPPPPPVPRSQLPRIPTRPRFHQPRN
jgi:hypothetical protein